MIGWRRYRHCSSKEIVNATRVEYDRKVAGAFGVDEARAGDYIITNSRGKLWVEPGWLFEEVYVRVEEGEKG